MHFSESLEFIRELNKVPYLWDGEGRRGCQSRETAASKIPAQAEQHTGDKSQLGPGISLGSCPGGGWEEGLTLAPAAAGLCGGPGCALNILSAWFYFCLTTLLGKKSPVPFCRGAD